MKAVLALSAFAVGCASDASLRSGGGPNLRDAASDARSEAGASVGGVSSGGTTASEGGAGGTSSASGGRMASGGGTGGAPSSSGGRVGSGGAANARDATVDRASVTDTGTNDAPAVSDARSARDARDERDSSGAVVDSSGADATADAARDGSALCPTDAAAPLPAHSYTQFCTNDPACNYVDPGFDPCTPSICLGTIDCYPVSAVAGLSSAADGTPCDDHRPDSFVYPASDGCPSNRCVGGGNDGAACGADADCPGGECFMNRCVEGPNSGSPCSSNADCDGGMPNANCVPSNRGGSYCDGGAETWNACRLVCVGGTWDGQVCRNDAACSGPVNGTCAPIANSSDCPPKGKCVRWKSDPTTGACTAVSSNPFCNTVADCPTTKYCALDTRNLRAGPETCWRTDSCCEGSLNWGPCVAWDTCDTVNHVCVRTHGAGDMVTCGGITRYKYGDLPCGFTTNYSVGSVCNDVCRGGRCTSRFAQCR